MQTQLTTLPATKSRVIKASLQRSETAEQQAVIRWWNYSHRGLGVTDHRLLFAIPNGGKRTKINGCRLRSEGLRAGIPDLFLAVPTRFLNTEIWRHGLFIEMKTDIGRASDAQLAVISSLRDEGYECVIARGAQSAIDAITAYLRGEEVRS